MTDTRTVSVQLHDTTDIKKPTFLLDVSAISPNANYCKCVLWNTFYFLGEPVIMDGVRCTVTGTLDPLTTYAEKIRDLSGYLVRTETDAHKNRFINDAKRQAQTNRHCITYTFDRSPFTANYATDIVYLLTVIGGSHK
jgi:hypothetical protein